MKHWGMTEKPKQGFKKKKKLLYITINSSLLTSYYHPPSFRHRCSTMQLQDCCLVTVQVPFFVENDNYLLPLLSFPPQMNLLESWQQTLVSILYSLMGSYFFPLLMSLGLSMRAHSDEWMAHTFNTSSDLDSELRKAEICSMLIVRMFPFNTLPLSFCYSMLLPALIHYFQLAMLRTHIMPFWMNWPHWKKKSTFLRGK